jgi:hypothetical protein
MKKTKLIIIILLSLGLKGMTQTNNLIVFDQQGDQFWLILNGVKQNTAPQTNVKVTGLNANTYKATVIFKDSTKTQIEKTIFFQNMGTEETYNVVTKTIPSMNLNAGTVSSSKGMALRCISAVPLAQAAPADPSQTVIAYGSPAPANTAVGTTTTVTQQTTTAPNGGSVSMSVGGTNVGMNVNGAAMGTTQTTVTTTTTSTGTDPNSVQQAPAPSNTGCVYPMGHEDYESAKNSIAAKDFENTKLDMAKQIAGSNCLSAEEVRGIMKMFTFENTKLDFAKFAYAHTTDKSNYFKVNDAFQFDSSATDLSNYISTH